MLYDKVHFRYYIFYKNSKRRNIYNGENLYTLFEYIDNLYMYIFTIFWQ